MLEASVESAKEGVPCSKENCYDASFHFGVERERMIQLKSFQVGNGLQFFLKAPTNVSCIPTSRHKVRDNKKRIRLKMSKYGTLSYNPSKKERS